MAHRGMVCPKDSSMYPKNSRDSTNPQPIASAPVRGAVPDLALYFFIRKASRNNPSARPTATYSPKE